ncbi:sialidase family protein [Niabella beijingensis]|uniref:sialidase family protein n=1 Tax=Niabella beijingensis TaxID=2872700 RepID=UPI001CC03C88|nr:sialidase family protein [Niabella beijingensis]MBZ4190882.1 glycoside hydrolase [Niabella beijingensis]
MKRLLTKKGLLIAAMLYLVPPSAAQSDLQQVEGFDTVVFHYDANRARPVRDFRGTTPGYMTAGWWSESQLRDNRLSWRTAVVPEKKRTTFSFIGASAVVPAAFSEGPRLKLLVNGHYALTFFIGATRDFIWEEGGYELKYLSRRTEFPYTSAHRQFELNGNSGIYQLTVPASAVEAGKSVVLEVQQQPFKTWEHGWFMIKKYRNVLEKPTVASLSSQVEVLRKDVNLLNEQTHILATQLYSEMLGRSGFEHQIIYTNGYRHEHPADLIRLQNGELLLFTREATEHFANDGDIVMLRSKDDGKTWGGRQVVSAVKDLDEREGCGIQLKDGTIVLGVFYNDLYKADGIYNWDGKEKLPELNRPRLGAHIITSTDNGNTWSAPHFIDLKDMPFKGLEGPTDAPVELPDGSMVMGVIGYGIDGDSKNIGSVLIRSADKGKHWKYVSTIAGDPGGTHKGFVEPGIVRTRSGRIIAALRNGATEGAIYMTYSDDNGKTWVPVWKTDMIGHPVDLVELKDGRIMATYGIREGRHTQPGGIRACFSSDNGRTWDIATEVQIRNDFINWDVGYPESLELKDGKVLTVYYFNLFGKYFIGGTFWKPDAK